MAWREASRLLEGALDDGEILTQAARLRHLEGVAHGLPHAARGYPLGERLVRGAPAEVGEHVARGDHRAVGITELAEHQTIELTLTHSPRLSRPHSVRQTSALPDGRPPRLRGRATSLRARVENMLERTPAHVRPGTRVLVTGAARGIGAALATQLASHGARVAFTGIEPDALEAAASAADSPSYALDVSDRDAVDEVVDRVAADFGGLDVVVANAGIARQLPMTGGDPSVMERMLEVNTLGAYYTARAAARHVAHPGGYLLMTSSLAAAVHLPLLGAYSASKAAVEAVGDTLRIELRPDGARVGVAYFAELDTEMTSRGFDTGAAHALLGSRGTLSGLGSLPQAVDRIERGIARRSRTVCAPAWVRPVVPLRHLAQRAVELRGFPNLREALEVARSEDAPWTTPQPDGRPSARHGEHAR